MNDDRNIAAAVQMCINVAGKSNKPFRGINDFRASLKEHGWFDADRLIVQQQVLDEMKRLRQNGDQ